MQIKLITQTLEINSTQDLAELIRQLENVRRGLPNCMVFDTSPKPNENGELFIYPPNCSC